MFIQLRFPFLSQDNFNVTSFVSTVTPSAFRPMEKLPVAVFPLLLAYLLITYQSESNIVSSTLEDEQVALELL